MSSDPNQVSPGYGYPGGVNYPGSTSPSDNAAEPPSGGFGPPFRPDPQPWANPGQAGQPYAPPGGYPPGSYPPPGPGQFGPQQGYGQGYGPPPYSSAPYGQYGTPPAPGQPPPAGTFPKPWGKASRWGPTSVGLDAPIAAGLSYLIPLIGLIFFFAEKRNRFLKFHAAQALLTIIGLPWVVAAPFIVLGVILAVVFGSFGPNGLTQGPNSGLATLALFLPSCGIYLGYFGAVILWPSFCGYGGWSPRSLANM